MSAVEQVLFHAPDDRFAAMLCDLQQVSTCEDLSAWVQHHRLDAACLQTAAWEFWREGWRKMAHGRTDPPRWDQRRQELLQRPPAGMPYVSSKSIATVEEAQKHCQLVFAHLDENRQRLRARLPETEAADALRELEAQDERLRGFYERHLTTRRAEEAKRARDHALRPQFFDPSRETREEGERQWRKHCLAVTEDARRHGLSIRHRAPSLELAVKWIILFQLQDQTYEQIAAAEAQGGWVTPEVVRKAIARLAGLIGWNVRSAHQGTRRRRPAPNRLRA